MPKIFLLMRKIIQYVLILPLFLSSCSKSNENENFVLDNKVEVAIKSSSSQTRTAISDDLMSTEWVVGDQIAVWAQPTESTTNWALEAEKFTLKYYGSAYSEASFSANITPMEVGDYTFYSVYPYPDSTNGTQATFSLSAQQSGEYDGENDIMVAEPMVSSELTSSTIGMPALNFSHKMHMIRIEIPDGRNYYGKELSKLEVTFPQSVVGTITLDATTPDAAPTLSDGTSTITVNFAEPFETGEGKYIWLFVNPTTISGEIKFIGYNSDGSCSAPIRTTVSDLVMKASNITKLTLSLKESEITTLNVTISSTDMLSKIGESLQKVTFTAPSGNVFTNGDTTLEMDAQSNSDIYSISFYNASEFATPLTSGSLGVELETQSVIKTADDISLSNITIAEDNALAAVVPNFFTTTFSDISPSGTGADAWELVSEADPVAIGGMTDWWGGNRSTWTAGSYVTIRSYSNAGGPYQSIFFSATLNDWGLKPDADAVTITVSYTAYWTKNKSSSMQITTGLTTELILDQTLRSRSTSDGLSNKTTTTISADISSAVSDDRIAWKTVGENASWYYYFNYDSVNIDNVTVKIK